MSEDKIMLAKEEQGGSVITETKCCKDWIEKCNIINGMAVFCYVHGQRFPDFRFKFCPWCGKKDASYNQET